MLFFSRAQPCVFEKKDLGAVFVEIDYRFQFRYVYIRILQPQNALYWHRNFFDWLDRWCK